MTGVSPSGPGHSPKGGAASASPAKLSVPNATLLKLAGQCEKAAGPDVRIDIAIHHATKYETISVPPFTECIDAAAALVPGGHKWSVFGGGYASAEPWDGSEGDEECGEFGKRCATPALALCAAALKARAASAIETQRATTVGRGPQDESAVGAAETPQ